MQLLPDDVAQKLPPLYSQEEQGERKPHACHGLHRLNALQPGGASDVPPVDVHFRTARPAPNLPG